MVLSLRSHARCVVCVFAGAAALAAVSPVNGGDPKPSKTFQDKTYTRTMCVAFSPDGKLLAVAAGTRTNDKGATLVWEVETGKLRHTLRIDKAERIDIIGHEWVGFDPKGKNLASVGSGFFFLWDSETGKHLRTFAGKGSFSQPAWSPDGKFIAAGSAELQKTPLSIWEIASDNKPEVLTPHPTAPLLCVTFYPDGKSIISGGSDRTIRLTELGSKKTLATLSKHEGAVRYLALSPDGKVLASAGYDGLIKLWDLGKGEETASIRDRARDVTRLAFSPDGKLVASTSNDGWAYLWDASTGKLRGDWKAHTFGAYGVAFSPDGKTIATCSENTGVRLWPLQAVLATKD